MREILKEISEKALLLGDFKFTDEQVKTKWFGFAPAKHSEIKKTEERLGIELPEDYKQFMEITNGFSASQIIFASFMPVEKIDYLKVFEPNLIKGYRGLLQDYPEMKDTADGLEASILVGGLDEEQQTLLIPPHANSGKWGYWFFANWYPGEERYNSLKEYLLHDLSFLKRHLKETGIKE